MFNSADSLNHWVQHGMAMVSISLCSQKMQHLLNYACSILLKMTSNPLKLESKNAHTTCGIHTCRELDPGSCMAIGLQVNMIRQTAGDLIQINYCSILMQKQYQEQ